jgi:hypothetical protein
MRLLLAYGFDSDANTVAIQKWIEKQLGRGSEGEDSWRLGLSWQPGLPRPRRFARAGYGPAWPTPPGVGLAFGLSPQGRAKVLGKGQQYGRLVVVLVSP